MTGSLSVELACDEGTQENGIKTEITYLQVHISGVAGGGGGGGGVQGAQLFPFALVGVYREGQGLAGSVSIAFFPGRPARHPLRKSWLPTCTPRRTGQSSACAHGCRQLGRGAFAFLV